MKSVYIDTQQIHSNSDNTLGYYITATDGLDMPSMRVPTYDKPGEFGAFVSNQLYGRRLVTFEGEVFGSSLTDFQSKRRALENAIQIVKDSNSIPVAKTLKFTTMDDLALQASCYMQKFVMKIDIGMWSAKYMMELICPDFGLESQNLSTIVITTPGGGGAVYPVIYPVIYAAGSGGLATVVNNGNTNAYPIITLNGLLTNPVILNVTTGRYISLGITIGASDTPVVIDMKNKTILQGSTPVIGDKNFGSDWWWLASGSNLIQVTTGNISDTGNVSISYRDTYIGI